MPYGYWGKLLEIDLEKQEAKERNIKEGMYKKYLGGSGLGAKLLFSEFDMSKDPLHSRSPLMFITGLLTGTRVPTACKLSVVGKSPLTGIWGESTVGGFWGERVKRSGYDGYIIKGSSQKPVSLMISDEEVKFSETSDLWGEDVYETERILKDEFGDKAEVACIGPAGENLVKIAGIMIGGRETRAAGRCGFGALMGSKNLKALVVKGGKKPEIKRESELTEKLKEYVPELQDKSEGLSKYGTAGGVPAVEAHGDLPIKNWRQGSWEEGAEKISGQAIAKSVQTEHYACFACPIRCGKNVEIKVGPHKGEEGHGPEYETCAAFGSNILNDDLDYLCAANDLCNRYGLDTISTGNVIAMAIECFQSGVVNKNDTGGIELEWGNGQMVLELINKIVNREDIGDVLAEGVKEAAGEIGGLAREFAVHTKGLSYAFHDPRAFTSMAANYATANRGACHLEALSYFTESGTYPAENFGFSKDIDLRSPENKGELAAVLQNLMNVFNALGLCKFLIRGEVTPENLQEWLNDVTGWKFTVEDILESGERLHNLKRMYNVRLGISRKDDALPARLLHHDRKTGRAAGSLPHIGQLLRDYYSCRDWDEEGIPKNEKLQELDLEFLI